MNCDHQGAAGPFHSSMEVLGRHPWAETEMPMQVAGPGRQRKAGGRTLGKSGDCIGLELPTTSKALQLPGSESTAASCICVPLVASDWLTSQTKPEGGGFV